MKNVIVGIAIAFFFGCEAKYSIPADEENLSAQVNEPKLNINENLITFKVNGEQVRSTAWTISRFVWNNNIAGIFMNITSNMHDDKRAINVNLDGSVPGRYLLEESGTTNKKSYGSYYPDYAGDQGDSYSFTNGVFELTEVDTVKNRVNGCFYGKVKNTKGDSLEITQGRIINGFLKVDITNY